MTYSELHEILIKVGGTGFVFNRAGSRQKIWHWTLPGISSLENLEILIQILPDGGFRVFSETFFEDLQKHLTWQLKKLDKENDLC